MQKIWRIQICWSGVYSSNLSGIRKKGYFRCFNTPLERELNLAARVVYKKHWTGERFPPKELFFAYFVVPLGCGQLHLIRKLIVISRLLLTFAGGSQWRIRENRITTEGMYRSFSTQSIGPSILASVHRPKKKRKNFQNADHGDRAEYISRVFAVWTDAQFTPNFVLCYTTLCNWYVIGTDKIIIVIVMFICGLWRWIRLHYI
jgi:hypothetical protein